MNTNAIAQNKAYYEQLTPDNCAMLLIDHQAGLFLGVKSIDLQILKNNAIALAKTAKVFDLATVMRLTQAGGIMTNWIAVAAELKHDEDRDTSVGMNKAFGEHMGLYDFLGDIAAAGK